MSKYSKQIKDHVVEQLGDERRKYVDGEIENYIFEQIAGDMKKWPKEWKSPNFNPSDNLIDAYTFLATCCPKENFRMLVKEEGTIFEAYVRSEDYSVFAHKPSRAIVLAVWNAHCLSTECKDEGVV